MMRICLFAGLFVANMSCSAWSGDASQQPPVCLQLQQVQSLGDCLPQSLQPKAEAGLIDPFLWLPLAVGRTPAHIFHATTVCGNIVSFC